MKLLRLFALLIPLSFTSLANGQILEKVGGLFKKPKTGMNFSLKKRIYLMGSLGNSNLNAGINYRIRKDKNKKWQFFAGARANFNTIKQVDRFETAPAKYRTGNDAYEAGFVKANRDFIDTFRYNGTAMNSLNAYVHVSYTLVNLLGVKITVEGNTDIAGINFGSIATASPTSNFNSAIATNQEKYNFRIGGTNDIGTLNGEFLLRFGIDKVSIHMGYSISKRAFVSDQAQTLPNGDNYKFRSTTNGTVFGLRYRI